MYSAFTQTIDMLLCAFLSFSLLLQVTAAIPDREPSSPLYDCEYRRNLTSILEYRELNARETGEVERCLYYYLYDMFYRKTGDFTSFHSNPPPEKNMTILIDNVVVRHVELVKGSTFQFVIYGDIYMMWEDSRLTWNETEWKMDSMSIEDEKRIWFPSLIDHSICTDGRSCETNLRNIIVMNDGKVYGTLEFRYTSYCAVDFKRYPEEENNCCIFFTAFETGKEVTFRIEADENVKMNRPVTAQANMDRDNYIATLTQEHTAWVTDSRSVGVSHLGGISSLQVLRVCTHAEKKMSTLRMALRLPVTIATLIMLVSPLFGDLRIQAYVKLVTFCIQTICFLYLCSIAPPNGFAGNKPLVYIFYELIFLMTTFSFLFTMSAMALCRVKRTVPPSHRVYLVAKLINRVICCVEPNKTEAYHRYVEGNEEQQSTNEPDYTQDWRHIYVAVNNLISGLLFSIFILCMLFSLV